jgi:hypothetical protein
MGMKYSSYQTRKTITTADRRRIHPIWRGIGFAMMVLFPLIGYAGMKVMMAQPWFPLPVDLFAKRSDLIYRILPDPLIYIKILTMLSIILVLSVIFMLLSFIINSAFGLTDRRDPYYVPPVRRQSRRR